MKIFVVGSGKLANAILNADLTFKSAELLRWESKNDTFNEKAIVVHAGSGRQLSECLAFCAQTKSVFIELSTGMSSENVNPDFPLIICPNTSILLIKTLNVLKNYTEYFEQYDITITESHQSTKTTEPGTAFAFANALNFPVGKITSIREPEIQMKELGIPKEFINKHAYHKIVMKDGNDEVTIETKVLGHNSYAAGVKKIVEVAILQKLENKRYGVLDLIDKNLL